MADITLDDFLVEIGDLGKYQKKLIVLCCLLVIPSCFQTYIPLFILSTPLHRCALDNMDNDTWAVQGPHHQLLINASFPSYSDPVHSWARCQIWRPLRNDSSNNNNNSSSSSSSSSSNSSNSISSFMSPKRVDNVSGTVLEKCGRWVYDRTYYNPSLVEKLNLVCDRKEFRTYANMSMMMGKLIAGLMLGIFSDIMGRKRTLVVCILFMVFGNFINLFVFDTVSLIAFRFLAGITTTSIYLAIYVLALEFMSPAYRRVFNILASLVWIAGGVLLNGLAYLLRDYWYLSLAVALPTVPFLAFHWIVYESPRWLLSRGRSQEAKVILQKVAKANGVAFPEEKFEKMLASEVKVARDAAEKKLVSTDDVGGDVRREGETDTDRRETLVDVCRYRTMSIRFALVIVNWIVNSLVYYALLFNTSNLSGSIYLNFFLINCVDVVANLIAFFLLEKLGRKMSYCGFMLTATLSCLITILPFFLASGDLRSLVINILALVGRGAVATSFNILYLYSAELFPTTVRNSVMGTCSMISRVGAIMAPYTADLGVIIGGPMSDILPQVVCGGSGFLALCLTLILPETVGRPLPTSVKQHVQLNKRKSDWSSERDVSNEKELMPIYVRKEKGDLDG
ncbi:organic cation transporter protein [Aplysia californica]|uniref:Organic cation transporter protein n=1 Tax=Aplysia californica TaxID=6500 RepID=A0ABM0JZG4_APLCA|nr:organic cation transporter protein [Aplysia californica]